MLTEMELRVLRARVNSILDEVDYARCRAEDTRLELVKAQDGLRDAGIKLNDLLDLLGGDRER